MLLHDYLGTRYLNLSSVILMFLRPLMFPVTTATILEHRKLQRHLSLDDLGNSLQQHIGDV